MLPALSAAADERDSPAADFLASSTLTVPTPQTLRFVNAISSLFRVHFDVDVSGPLIELAAIVSRNGVEVSDVLAAAEFLVSETLFKSDLNAASLHPLLRRLSSTSEMVLDSTQI